MTCICTHRYSIYCRHVTQTKRITRTSARISAVMRDFSILRKKIVKFITAKQTRSQLLNTPKSKLVLRAQFYSTVWRRNVYRQRHHTATATSTSTIEFSLRVGQTATVKDNWYYFWDEVLKSVTYYRTLHIVKITMPVQENLTFRWVRLCHCTGDLTNYGSPPTKRNTITCVSQLL